MEIFSANFLETKRLSLMNSGDLYKMLHCKHYMRDRHRIRVHTHEWSYECNICLGRDVWWGCITPGELRKHMQSTHPEEFKLQEEELAAKTPYVCANNRCKKRFETQIECDRHMMKMH